MEQNGPANAGAGGAMEGISDDAEANVEDTDLDIVGGADGGDAEPVADDPDPEEEL